MSLADGLAAVVGTWYGRGNTYRVLSHAKSVAGTATFIVVSALILAAYAAFGSGSLPGLREAAAAVAGAAILENLGLYGLDNLLVPLFVGFLLSNW
jgi:dolichol kinase